MPENKSKNRINPGERFTQNLWLLYNVNEKFRNEINNIKKSVPILKLSVPSQEEILNFSKEEKEDWERVYTEEETKLFMKQYAESRKIFRNAVSKLRLKFNLSHGYQGYLEDLVQEGDKFIYSEQSLPMDVTPFVIKNPDNPREWISVISINSETSLETIQTFWKQIKTYSSNILNEQNGSPSKKYDKKNLDRDLIIYQLKQSGKSYEDIANEIKGIYPGDFGYQEINIIIKRLKDKAKQITTR